MYRYFKTINSVDNMSDWKSKGLSKGLFNPLLDYFHTKMRSKFSGSCLKQDKATHVPRNIVNIYIVYEICRNYNISRYPTLKNCLVGAVSLTKTC